MLWLLGLIVFLFPIFFLHHRKKVFSDEVGNLGFKQLNQQEIRIKIETRHELVELLKENIGNIVTIQSDELIHIHDNQIRKDKRKIIGKILEVDETWINLEYDSRQFVRKKTSDQLIFRIDQINRIIIKEDCAPAELL